MTQAKHRKNFLTSIKAEGSPDLDRYPAEVYLLIAILSRAVKDLLIDNSEISQEARRWFRSQSHKPWSYLWICQHTRICPSALKQGLEKAGCFDECRDNRPLEMSERLGAFIAK